MSRAMIGSGVVRNAIRSGSAPSKRLFSSSAHHDVAYEAKEASKWEKITYLGITTCTILAFVNLSKGHHHFEQPPPYSYLHIRNKEYPWGSIFLVLGSATLCRNHDLMAYLRQGTTTK